MKPLGRPDPTNQPLIKANALLCGVNPVGLDEFIDDVALLHADVGEVILSEGGSEDVTDHAMYLLLSGKVAVSRALPDEREHVMTTISGNTFFGEMAVLGSGPRSARIAAVEPSVIGRIDVALFQRLLDHDALTIVRNISVALAQRLRETNDIHVERLFRQEKLAAIGEVVRQIGHDLKSPLAAVVGVADLLEEASTGITPASQAGMLRRAAQSVSGLVEDILAFASDQPRRQHTLFAFDELLINIEDFGLAPLERRGRIKVDRRIEPVGFLYGDHVAIERMLLNLIKNAGEAMTAGGLLTFVVQRLRDEVLIEVADTGAGIPDDIRGRLFQMFVTAGKAGGTGLGLAMAKRTVDQHAGTIAVESERNVGTRFTVLLPAAPSSDRV
jgi:signal transduction histidine kinase